MTTHIKIRSHNKLVVMGDIEKFACDNHHLKCHGYFKYHDISKLVVTAVHSYTPKS